MITSKTSRIALKNLLPSQKYAVQVRAVDSEGIASEWSRKFTFSTVANNKNPQTPTNVTWEPSGNSFTGKWSRVTKDIAGDDIDIARYEVELFAEALSQTEIVTVDDGPTPVLTFGIDRNRSLFGRPPQNDLSMRVRAVSVGGLVSDWSDSLRAANNPPAMVQNFKATAIVDGVVLTWDENSEDDLRGYRVWVGPDRSIELSENNLIFRGRATTFTYYTMTYSEHSFAIAAVDDYGTESEIAWAEATPISPFVWDDEPPVVPNGLSVTREGSQATVSWSPIVDDDSVAGYDIMYIRTADIGAVTGQDSWLLADMKNVSVTEGTTTVINNLDPVASYQFKIRAYDQNINFSDWSAPVEEAGTPNTPPATPTNFSLEPAGTTILARWDRNSEADVISYVLEVDTVNTFSSAYKRTYSIPQTPETVSRIQFDVPKLEEETAHYARLRAIDSAADKSDTEPDTNKSAWTATQSSTTGIDFPPDSDNAAPATAPANVQLRPGIGHFNPRWDEVANADPVKYEVHLSTVNNFTVSANTLILRTSGTSAFVRSLPGGGDLAYNTTYYLKVRAIDADGNGPASTQVSGQIKKVVDGDVSTISVNKVTTGTLTSTIFTLGTGGQIRSSDSSFTLDSTGLTITKGTVSAGVLKGGTISGTTINVGSGGVINVDSTASIQSSNYVAGTSGWKLSSTGLEANDLDATLSADNITGGTFSAGAIYVASGGGIYDANGYWSITPSSINIENGSINAGAITSGTLRSNAYAVNEDGSTNSSYWAWSLDKSGNAVLGNTYIRGRMLVSTGVIQSDNYYPGSQGWRISSNGQVYFNNATIYAGRFQTQFSGGRIEIGDTGVYDPTDEVRMWSSYGVSSIRNKSDESKPNVFLSLQGGNFKFIETDWPMIQVRNGSGLGTGLKFISNWVQVRDQTDSGYNSLIADNLEARGYLNVSGFSDFGAGITIRGVTQQMGQLNMNGYAIVAAADIGTGAFTAQDISYFRSSLHVDGFLNNNGAPTTSAGANVNMLNGRFRLSTSSRRFKENIQDATIDTDKVLSLEARRFQRNDELDKDDNVLPVTENSKWYIGFIAEEAADLGLNAWVTYDDKGWPYAFSYDQFVVAHQAVLQQHRDKITALEERLSSLENQLASGA